MSNLSMIEGIGADSAAKLKESGIRSLEELLKACETKKSRSVLAEKTEISEKLILKWANQADLFRIKGVGSEYAELLEASGVDTVPELAGRKAENLYKKMEEVNSAQSLVKKLPSEKQVRDWVAQAATLPRMLNY